MKIAVLGTGMVGQQIASKLVELGHEVMMGARSATNEKAAAWAETRGDGARHGSFADAVAFGEWAFNCTAGLHSLAALEAAGADNLKGKILLDLSNPLDFSKGFPPRLSVCNDDSLGEQIQRALPETRVVKTLNTMGNPIMVDAKRVPGDHVVFVGGEDAQAKADVSDFLREQFGWSQIIDLGGIDSSRGVEAWLLLWTRLYGALGHADFNLALPKAPGAGKDG